MMDQHIKNGLFALRLGVFTVMGMWTLDKFINPDHAARVFEKFYFIGGLSNVAAYAVGAVQAAIVLAFLLGFKKKFSYGAVLLLHAISTFSSYGKYFDPWTGVNLLFFAAWPMLAACYMLYRCRELDTRFTVG
jgi:hypothetical protein